ncbi:hypothetical protein GGH94_002417 [Coemansia aciculifera]|uniref:FAS1 domain-containing protein n=1 Tax=Coemansia aciculifera TaxID=417176 RepID=A0A9W8IJ30_9FUNG|nr:hypothetical protein GGH94_002417 [Coemansia aciculifera]
MRRLGGHNASLLLALALVLLLALLVQGTPGPLNTDTDPNPEPDPDPDSDPEKGRMLTTFVDLLSSDTRFSEFLHTVQRLGMVIPLNRLRNATLLVPTNEAIRRFRREQGQDSSHAAGSIYRGVADSQAWYHLIGDGIIEVGNLTQGPMVWESLSSSESIDYAAEPGNGIMLKTVVGGNSKVLANGVPVIAHNYSCVAGNAFQIDGLLTLPPTLWELLQAEAPKSDDATDGGSYSAMEKLLTAAGWSGILSGSGVSNESSRMHTLWAFNNQAFSSALDFGERAYLLYGPAFTKDEDADIHGEAIEDARTFAAGYVSSGAVSLARLGVGTHTISGFQNRTGLAVIVEEQRSNGDLGGYINGLAIGRSDIVARNGIVHGIDQVGRPGDLVFSPQKILAGLNATMFIRLLKETKLADYIDGSQPERKITLLVPTNRAMEDAFGYGLGDGADNDQAAKAYIKAVNEHGLDGASTIASVLGALPVGSPREQQLEWALYHIAEGQSGLEELVRSPLLRTKLAAEWTGGKAQVVKAQVDQAHGTLSRHVSFNGADNILPEPVVVGNTTVYLLSSPMPTPPNLINALVQDLDLSLFVAAMGASGTADEIQHVNGITVLAPVVSSFTSLDLVWSYLSLPGDSDARTDLSRLIKSHILKKPIYSDEIPMHTDSSAETLTVESLNGNKVGMYRTPHGVFVIADQANMQHSQRHKAQQHGEVHARLASVADTGSLKLSETDVLLRTGVAHVLGQGLILPPNVDITSPKLLRGMKAHIFANLLERFNLTYVLEDPRTSSSRRRRLRKQLTARSSDIPDNDVVGYSILVPSDKAWRENAAYRELARRDHEELSSAEDDENPWRNSTTLDLVHHLDMLVRLHIIPVVGGGAEPNLTGGNRLPESQLLLADRKTYPTMLEGVRLRAHEFASDRFSVQLDRTPFYQSPGGVPFISFATVVRSGVARTGAVFELDAALKLPPDDGSSPGGWKKFAWNAAVWLTGIGMGSGLLGASGYWVRQWWTRSDYQSL